MGKKFTMHSSMVPITTGIGFIDLVAVDDSCCCNNVNKFFNSVLVDWRGRWTNSHHQQVNRRDRRRFVSGTRWWLELNWNCARLYDGTRRRIQRESGLFFSYANEYPLPNFDPSGSLSPGSATGQQTLVAGSFWRGFSQWQCDVCDRSSMQMRKNRRLLRCLCFYPETSATHLVAIKPSADLRWNDQHFTMAVAKRNACSSIRQVRRQSFVKLRETI